MLRPRIIWKVVPPIAAGWTALGLASARDNDLVFSLALVLFFVFLTLYFWSARVEVRKGRVSVVRFGRRTRSWHLGSLKSWDVTWGEEWRIPTKVLWLENPDGSRLTLNAIAWQRWSKLKDAVIESGAPKADIREELGPRPVRTTILGGLFVGVLIFFPVLASLLLEGDDPIWTSVGVAAAIGVVLGGGTMLAVAWEYHRAKRPTADGS